MKYIIRILVILLLNNHSAIGQPSIAADKTDKYLNNIIDSCLLKIYPDSDENVLGNGRNYRYLSFRLTINDKGDTIKMVNFGENSTHRPSLILLLLISKNKLVDEILLCQRPLEIDLKALTNFYFRHDPIAERYKVEMIGIWLQSRKGIIRTDCYIH